MNLLRPSDKDTFFLTLILLLAFSLRIWGITFGLPHLYHADEPIVVNHALAYGSGDLHPHFFRIPPLTSYLLFLSYGAFYVFGTFMGGFHSTLDFERLFYTDPSAFYLIGRVLFGVIPGVLGVFFLYRSTFKVFGRGRALAASLLLAATFIHVRDSHYIYADMPLLMVLTAAFGSFFGLLRPDGGTLLLKRHAAAGFWIGLAAAFKYNGAFLVLPYLAACFFQTTDRKGIPLGAIVIAGVVSAVTFAVLNPFALLDFPFFLKELSAEGAAHSGGTSWKHPLLYSALEGAGPLMLGFALAGLVSLLRPQGSLVSVRARIVMAVFFIGYYAVLVAGGQSYDRYILPLIPLIAFFASDAIFSLTESIQKPILRNLMIAGLVSAALFQPLHKSILLGKLLTAGDTRTEAKSWIEKHIPEGEGIALSVPFYSPRLSLSADVLKSKLQQIEDSGIFSEVQKRRLQFFLERESQHRGYRLYQLTHDQNPTRATFLSPEPVPYDAERLRSLGVSYIILERGHDEVRVLEFLRSLPGNIEPVARFTPFHSKSIAAGFDPFAMTGAPFLSKELYARQLAGPLLEIYKLTPSEKKEPS